MISQVFGGMENLSLVGDTSGFKTDLKHVVIAVIATTYALRYVLNIT